MPEAAQQQAPGAHRHDDGTIAPAFDEEMSIRKMKASFSLSKGTLTRLTGQIKVRAKLSETGGVAPGTSRVRARMTLETQI